MQRYRFLAVVVAASLFAATRCCAQETFSGMGTSSATGNSLDAKATFNVDVNGNLQVSLSNTSTADVINNPDILTGVFFGVTGTQPTLTPGSAAIQPGAKIFNWPAAGVTTTTLPNISHEWAFSPGTSVPNGNNSANTLFGIGAAGFLNNFQFFPGGSNLSGPANSPGGIDWGLTSAGDVLDNHEHGSVATDPLIQGTVSFTLTGWNHTSLDKINNVYFQYGTSLTEPRVAGADPPSPAPEPGTLSILGLAVAPLVQRLRRRPA